MAMIPPDVGVRLRLPGDAGLLPAAPVTEVPADLPDFQPGRVFSARIQDVLPENTYRALVAGRQMTLSLPEGAKAGDTLELVVIDRTPQLIVARQASPTPTTLAAGKDPYTILSPTARMISQLLGEQPQTAPAQLNKGAPLLPTPPGNTPQNVGQLALALAQGVAQSGLFYEAHQAQWVAGKRPLGQLLQEPQAQFGTQEKSATEATSALVQRTNSLTPTPTANATVSSETQAAASSASSNTNPSQVMPEELRPLVHQQLEAAATQRMFWHGELWPGQAMQWEIHEEGHAPQNQDEGGAGWNTTLRLTTPRLGNVEALMSIQGNTLQLTLSTPYGASAADLRDGLPLLAEALASRGLTLGRSLVRHDTEEGSAP